MSGFFGIFNRNGNPVEKKIAEDMLESMSEWDPDERDLWINGSVALGHAMLWNTPESKYEHLPLNKDASILTMDARIDNREELATEVELPDRPMSEIGDSEFILAAYEKWGEECPKHLLGDFSFVIWDEKEQHVFCARDHIGIKSFYYYIDDEFFVFSNDIEGILSHENVSNIFDDNTIAMYMQGYGVEAEQSTFFEKIKKLPASTSLVITNKNIFATCYWKIEETPSIVYDNLEAYGKKLRELLESAVEMRIRTQYPVISHLSGGIDSSSIAVLAARMLKKKNQKLHVFNWINIPKNLDDYEYEAWNFSRRIAEAEENIEHHEFFIDPEYMVQQYDHHNVLTKGTLYAWHEYYVQNEAYKSNTRTILSGWGGDELISYSGYSYIGGLFRQGKFLQAFKYLFDEKKQMEYPWKRFIKRTILEIVSPSIIDLLRKKSSSDIHESKECIFASKKLFEILNKYKVKNFSTVVGIRKMQMMYYHNGHILERVESWALSSFSKRVEYSYPLLDKRIVEFAVSVPEELFYPSEGKCRHLIRNAVSDLLPFDILWFTKVDEIKINQTYKKEYTEALKILQHNMQKTDCKRYQQNYIDCEKLKETLLLFDLDKDDSYSLGKIITAYMLMKSIKQL